MTIRHIVAWKLASDDAAERAEQSGRIRRELLALRDVVPGIVDITVGADVIGGANWDLAIVADFTDVEALEGYAVHPAHQDVVTYVRSVVSDRVAVDFEL
ncbi:Dabb family protein [Microbacterium sp. cx-55]|uniref:Dabb family protein n=1 Tax=Microbacterium sp. cx-55 TaxID=2875948 RepID=UPI001CBB4F72|nr:Dabb family protein [Microbacterium sp. cx-55]MBZ4487836.1 Dabb family protein [Microbacterium sp. cx-55]UGB34753.1 Dabb family protein [Microbacterium sp. cx-55]